MSKVEGLNKNILKATVDEMEFVRVTNINGNDEVINVIMYIKINNKYKVILPNELPHQTVNKLAIDNTYSKMTEEEIVEFLNAIENIKEDIKEQNQFLPLEYLAIDRVIDINYVVAKEKQNNYYALDTLRVNEFGMIQSNSPVTPLELPYVLIDIISKDSSFNDKTYLVSENIFAHIYKEDNKYLVSIFEFKPKENDNPSVQIIGLFTLIEFDNSYTVVFDEESKLFIEVTNEKFHAILDDFLSVIGLEKI